MGYGHLFHYGENWQWVYKSLWKWIDDHPQFTLVVTMAHIGETTLISCQPCDVHHCMISSLQLGRTSHNLWTTCQLGCTSKYSNWLPDIYIPQMAEIYLWGQDNQSRHKLPKKSSSTVFTATVKIDTREEILDSKRDTLW